MALDQSMTAGAKPPRRFRWVRWLVWSALLLAAAVTITARIFLSPERLRSMAQSHLAGIVEGKVHVAEARFALSQGILLKGITIEDARSSTKRPVVQIDGLLLTPRWRSLLEGSLVLRSIRVDGAQVNMELDAAGGWPFLKEIHLPARPGASVPRIELRGMQIEVTSATPAKTAPELRFSPVTADVRPSGADGWSAELWAKEASLGDLHANFQEEGANAPVRGNMRLLSSKVLPGPNLREFLPSSVEAEILDLSGPAGSLSLDAELAWDKRAEAPLRVTGAIQVRDLSLKLRSLPYPITGLNATITFANRELCVVAVEGKAAQIALAGSGTAAIEPGGEVSCDLSATAKGVRAERAVYDKLPAGAQRVWDWINPTQGPAGGALDVAVRILRQTGAATTISGDVELRGFACAPRRAPVLLTNLAGRIALTPEGIRTQGITGKAGDAPFSIVSGAFAFEKDGAFELAGAVNGLQVDDAFKAAVLSEASAQIPESVLKYLKEAKVSGRMDSSFEIARANGAREIRPDISLTLEGVAFSHPLLGRPLTLNARARYAGDTLTISQASASWGSARLEMPATTINLAKGAPKAFSVRVSNLELDGELHDLIPAGPRATWDEYGVGGTADIDFRLERGESAAHTRAEVFLRDGRMRYADFPYPVRQVFGRLEIVDGSVERAEFSGRNGPTLIDLTSVPNIYDGAPGRLVIIRAMDGVLDQDAANALPPSSRKLWDALKPVGKISLNVTVQHFWNKEVGAERATFTMLATLPEFSLETALPARMTTGRIQIEQANEEAPGKFVIQGRFDFADAHIERVALEGFRGTFLSRSGELLLENLAATCYGGSILGRLSLRQAAPPAAAAAGQPAASEAAESAGELQGNFAVTNADVRAITEGTDVKNISGRLDANSAFRGNLVDAGSFRAEGKMKIRDGEIGELPGVFAGLNLLQLRGLRAPVFHTLDLKYRIEGGTLTAEEVDFLGNILSLHGKGTLSPDGKLDFKFTPEFGPNWIPRIPGLNDLIDVVKKAVIPVTVGGNTNDPVWQLNPVLSLTRTIQTLMADLIPLNIAKPKPASVPGGETDTGPAK